MTDTNKALKPCPFCGQEPQWNNSKTTFSVQCSGSPDGAFYGDFSSQHRCFSSPSSGDWKTEDSAIAAWNTRAFSPNAVVISREDFENIVSRFKFCLDELWDDYKRSYSKSEFENYYKEEIEALETLSQYGETNHDRHE